MIDAVLFLLSHALLVLFGFAAFLHPSLQGFSVTARASAAWLLGAALLTAEAIVFSAIGLRWSLLSLAAPLLLLTAVQCSRYRRPKLSPRAFPDHPVSILALIVLAAALIHLTVCLITGRATSVDYIFFWGVKASRFAELGGIEHEFLSWPYAIHTHPNYPPLFPVTLSWGALVSGDLPWLGAVLTCVLWLVVAIPLVQALLTRSMTATAAWTVTSFWGVALALSLAYSFSGGNAESLLVVFETVALAALLAETKTSVLDLRALAAVGLVGAVLTKNEGVLAWGLLIVGVALRDFLWRKPLIMRRAAPLVLWPGLAIGLWIAFEIAYGVPLIDPARERGPLRLTHLSTIIREGIENLEAGSFGLAWIIPSAALIACHRRITAVLPGLTLAGGLLIGFFLFYLQVSRDPAELIGWTLPRVSQPALSALILSAGIVSLGSRLETQHDPGG